MAMSNVAKMNNVLNLLGRALRLDSVFHPVDDLLRGAATSPHNGVVDVRVVNFVCRKVSRETTQTAPRQRNLTSVLV
jgi:hypothetical protein